MDGPQGRGGFNSAAVSPVRLDGAGMLDCFENSKQFDDQILDGVT
jgi:hypothetical protein